MYKETVGWVIGMHELSLDGSYQRIDNRENSQFDNQTKLTQDYVGLAFYTL